MKLVYIEWFDHASFTENSWKKKEEFLELEDIICETVGWVLLEDKTKYVIVSTKYESEEFDDKYCSDMIILKGAVKTIKEIKLG